MLRHGSFCMVTGSWCIQLSLRRRVVSSRAAVKHGCRSKALEGQSQHHQAEQKAAETQHRVWILAIDLSSAEKVRFSIQNST